MDAAVAADDDDSDTSDTSVGGGLRGRAPKWVQFSGHDSTIMPLLAALAAAQEAGRRRS